MKPKLPPLNSLRAFEATARLGSVTRAAEELCVTHAAVSRQIKQLEGHLGIRLFARAGRGIAPTPEAACASPATKTCIWSTSI